MSAALSLSPARFALIALLVSAALLLGAYGFQYIGGLHPCRLCLFQRLPHALIIVGAIDLLLFHKHRFMALMVLAGLLVLYLISTWLSFYHVGVEFGWWKSAVTCSTGASFRTSEELMNQPMVRCDAVPWSLFGISMASYNMLISAGMSVLAALTLFGKFEAKA